MPEHDAAIAFADLPPRDHTGAPLRVTMLTRGGCHLCERAAVVLDEVCAQTGVAWTQADIDEHPVLLAEYGDWLPVVFVDGRRHDYWQVDRARLAEALAGR
ncbi:MAG: glutaredoxin family protein [Ornithinimicrobium sp.]|uniref:glutaredoxin family protein n=1 Tax=Ornithinimicrobium sp. TaxID=1977084 RepID=UPI003D9AD22F